MAEDQITEPETSTSVASQAAATIAADSFPLHLDLRHQLNLLLGDIGLTSASPSPPVSVPRIIFDYATSDGTSASTSQLLDALSLLAAYEGVSNYVLSRFRPILIDLLARWLDDAAFADQALTERRLDVLASISELHPELWSLITAFILKSPFKSSPLSVIPQDQLQTAAPERLHLLLLSYLRLLIADPHIASRHQWPVAPIHSLRTKHVDPGVRLLAIQVLSKQRGLSEDVRIQMEKECVGEVDKVNADITYRSELVTAPSGAMEIRRTRVDGWMLPVLEAHRIEKARQAPMDFTFSTFPTISSSDLSPHVTVIADGLLLRSAGAATTTILHVRTAPTDSALHSLCPLIQLGLPVLLTSSPSSGKTHILQYLSSTLHPSQQPTSRILTIPLADTSIDVKSLIGTYVSSPTNPGTFEWMEGALAKAIRAGRWVVFEDVDRGSTEMLVTLAAIARSLRPGRPGRRARLTLSGREDIEAGDGFALFATRTTRQGYTVPTFFGHHIFSEVRLESSSDDDILAILTARFQQLPPSILTALVRIWHQLRPFDQLSGQVKARDIGLRDLEKWCARVERNLPSSAALSALEQSGAGPLSNSVLQDEIFLEAVDIFVASLDSKGTSFEKKTQMIEVIATGLGMDGDRTSALDSRRPTLEISPGSRQLHIGRVVTEIVPSSRRETPSSSRPFALTRPSLILLERVAVALVLGEPTLLVGETGTGKTTAVQHIASIVRKPLTVLNLSMQTESTDLLGGFKPIDASIAARALHSRWQRLFCDTFSMAKPQNGAYVEASSRALSGRKWGRCAELWASSARRAIDKLGKGERILLDEVNLASQETLEAISTILEGPTVSLVLTERGDVEPIVRHPQFRLFACMNPATDVGKKDLPPNLRSRFTELYVPPPDDDREALIAIVSQYLGDAVAGDKSVILDVAELYTTLKKLSASKEIVDGSNAAPHFSMRTLARALTFAVESAPLFGLRRGLWEGFLMAFTMSLDAASARIAHEIGERFILASMKNARAVLAQIPTLPSSMDPDDFVRFGPFWLKRGPLAPTPESRYIITTSVQAKLSDLARVILTKRYPVLIQGPTSAGKTSAVEFLARQTGHRFVRINNHEHTDIQEYLGTYVTDPHTGNLVFQEGLLVTAVKQGHWIVLDELNLAPTDVLEALNRLLDDNRELVIPETQEVIKPHPNFILFATQNPPGLYAGRKVLSRAFRNRFLEVHFDDVPKDELETILCQRCQIAPSYARKIVQVFEELRHRRQASRVFESKQSFATLRDLFRWAERGAVGYQQLAEDGYMLLAERARQDEDKVVIEQVIEEIMKVNLNDDMYGLFDENSGILSRTPIATLPETNMVWTKAMQRLFGLVAAALAHNEPVLLVGETGCGKTSVCEVIAQVFGQKLVGVNCHQNMETADLLGSQRPVRNRPERKAKICAVLSQYAEVTSWSTEEDLLAKCAELSKRNDVDHQVIEQCQRELKQLSALFEWSDGPLVHAMTAGDLLLLDEVSLADDSVLERLNSVLEPGRTLVLAEKGGVDIDEATIVANPAFHVVATMNPGGDFGKKELSPALRNRFTEIWVPALNDRADLLQIIGQSWKHNGLNECGPLILDYFLWFGGRLGDSAGLGLRDILAWVNFSDDMHAKGLSPAQAFHHGGQMVLIDGLESLPQIAGMSTPAIITLRKDCSEQLNHFASNLAGASKLHEKADLSVNISMDSVSIGDFSISRGRDHWRKTDFRFEAPTTALNTMRLVRGCQLPKAILLEGSPGVGKTSLVSALAAAAGHLLQRINLSDQTDLIDLFGSDLPVEGGQPGEFQWRDAAFLDAMQKGDWVLLDEMNLASQTVLEGLNAVLDHRGTVFIPELGKSFDRHPEFRVFAAQNPLQQGGGRKGLPKSFLNRFTKVYLQEHTSEDLMVICRDLHPMPTDMVKKMISFNEVMREQTMITRMIGREGSPWEFNLRDLFRWFSLLSSSNGLEKTDHPVEYFWMVYRQRFRNERDREAVTEIFERIFQRKVDTTRPTPYITPSWLQVGHSLIRRGGKATIDVQLHHHHLDISQSVLKAIELGWLVILAGESGVGKRSLVRGLAEGAGRDLGEFAMHPGVDTSEILGSFEQQDIGRLIDRAYRGVFDHIIHVADSQPSVLARLDEIAAGRQQCLVAHDPNATVAFQNILENALADVQSHVDISAAQIAINHMVKASSNSAGFAWIDGQLIHAIKNGGWFLISDANLCSASVLDRLNSLCETNGTLVLSEKGSSSGTPELLYPHQDFRLFMTYDPRYGELSRAMRNRGVELFVGSAVEPKQEISQPFALANHSLLRSTRIVDSSCPAADAEQNASLVASVVANNVSVQSQRIIPYLLRYGQTQLSAHSTLYTTVSQVLSQNRLVDIVSSMAWQASDAQKIPAEFMRSLSIDSSLNANIRAEVRGAIFSVLQILLRSEIRHEQVQAWVADPSNAKSVLATSAASIRRGPSRNKEQAGKDVYPFTGTFRAMLRQRLSSMLTDSNARLLEQLERICVYVHLIEEHGKSTVFDYSSTRLLASWLDEEIKGLPALAPILEILRNLAKAVKLTTGMGQTQIWMLFRDVHSDLSGVSEAEKLCGLAKNLRDPELRGSVLQALSSMCDTNPSAEAVTELRDLLLATGSVTPLNTSEIASQWNNWPVLNCLELAMLVPATTNKHSLNVILEDRQIEVPSLLALQRSISSTRNPAIVFRAVSSWMQRLWDHADITGERLDGPADLFKPVKLASALRFSVTEGVKIEAIPEQDDTLRFSLKTALWSALHAEDRRKDASSLALSCIGFMCAAFGIPYQPTDDIATSLTQLSASLADFNNDTKVYLAEGFNRRIIPSLEGVSQNPQDLTQIGSLWLSASRFLLDVYVTNIPIDPGVRRTLLGEVLDTRLTLVREELTAVEAAEVVVKGVSDSDRVKSIRQRVAVLENEQAALGPALERPSDAEQLSYLFNEVHAFLDDQYTEARITELCDALRDGHPQAFAREHDFQLASQAFIRRLSTNYGTLSDLVQPIVTAVLQGKFGLRCMARDCVLRKSQPPTTVSAAVTFPLAVGVRQLQRLIVSGPVDKATGVPTELLAAAAHVYELDTRQQRNRHLPNIIKRLDHLYQTWSAVRLREQQDAQAAESLYRVKKTDNEVLSDVEQEEKEFAELFPQYEDAGAEDATPTKDLSSDKEEQRGFMSSQVAAFHDLILRVFGKDQTAPFIMLKKLVDEALHNDFDVSKFDENLDSTSLAYQVALLHRRQNDVRTSPVSPNFYLSPNEPEVRKAHSILIRLVERLNVLIDEWPEQMVLQHIRERCERILKLDTRCPVAAILSAMEQLLLHTEDWEGYANRDNSLAAFRDETSKLIIDWRRLELASWMRLLDDQAAQFVAQDNEWTLRLYGALIHGAVSTKDMVKHIDEVLPMVSTYINTSSFGQLTARLDLLESFENMASDLVQHTPTMSSIAMMLHNLVANARLFEPRVMTSMGTQRSTLDKAIKDFVRLASWKDVNVYALKASAVNSHRHLHRSIRKFRDLLRQPVGPAMGELNGIVPQEAPIQTELISTTMFEVSPLDPKALLTRQQSGQSLSEHLVRLDDILHRYNQIHARMRGALSDSTATTLDSMAIDVIETAAALAKETPSSLTKENTKIVNNLASRKRKAFADLLKTLRASGFSQNVKADQLGRQQSITWLASRPVIVTKGLPEEFDIAGVKKIDEYHHRMEVLMSALRQAFNGHNPDINSQDLQRGIGFVESVYATALTERDRVVTQLQCLSKLCTMLERFRHCAKSTSVASGRPLFDSLVEAEATSCQIHNALREVEEGVRQLRELQGAQVSTNDLAYVHELRQETTLLIKALSALDEAKDADCFLFTRDELDLLDMANRIRAKLIESFESQASASPEFRHLFIPVIDLVRSMISQSVPTNTNELSSSTWTKSDECIQSLLVVAQQLKAPELSKVEEDEYPHIPAELKEQRNFTISLRVSEVVDRLTAFAQSFGEGLASTVVPDCISRIVPFIETFAESYAQSVSTHIHTIKATYKLSYVVGRLMLDLAQKGFCKPSEDSQDGGEGQDGDTVEGTGMGSGSGEKNVSSEIKEESQVEGLQGEEEEEEEKNKDDGDDDDAFSMDEDFEGKLDDGNEKGEEGDSGDEEEEDEHDEHVGDVDPLDPGAVDEKFWGDDKEEDEKDGGSDEVMDQKTKEEEGESELTAKEKEGKESKDKNKEKDEEAGKENEDGGEEQNKQEQEKNDDEEGGDQEGEEMDDDEVMGEERDEEGEEQQAGQDQTEVAVPEGDTLDLPEDLNFDDEGEGGEGDDGPNDDMSMSGSEEDGDQEEGEGKDHDDVDMANEEDGEMAEDAPPATGQGEDETEEEAQMEHDVDVSASNEQAQESEVGKGVSGGVEGETEEDRKNEEKEDEAKDGMEAEAQGQDGVAPETQQQQGPSSDQQQADGPTDSSGAPLPADNSAAPQSSRSLGDILKEIRRRRDEILSQQEPEKDQSTEDQQAPQEAPGQVEYVKENEEKDDDTQALGAAGEEERQKLEDLNIVDEEQLEGEEAQRGMEDDDEQEGEDEGREQKEREANHRTRAEPEGEREREEKALTQADIGGRPDGGPSDDAMDVDLDDFDDGVEPKDIKPDVDVDEADLNIIDSAVITGQQTVAEDIWRRYASMTSDLSYALCEQLRLILEPTLATRLQGDFRTGKRLNMRKIIPYIASEYTKDKIWLRRTKPSRREYQVLLSLDDSRSMSESHSVDLAYQTLALVSQAMNKLEVGQVSIAKFGESVDILHPFKEGGFTDADGAKVMSSFKFDQHKTDVASLVERTLTYLAEARSGNAMSSGAPDLWQLQIIISDGVCQDHAKLRRLLRRAIEERVMIVFIIVDSLHQTSTKPASSTSTSTSAAGVSAASRPSILSMQTVEYKNVNGEMKLEMARYLDTFPFEFYVVLRDVEALPGVLADTLRQWMTRVSQSNE
ncbi:hypothetical protein IAR55_005333 [Kwoniella newhampshirensis]|uniref:Midasin n=1 Tax=Kwoniella newhampshirensis TaxID=1651941 RepID=A0AAW0YW15_9TREE